MFMDAYTKFEGGKAANMIGLMSDVGGWHEMNPILGADNVGVMLCPGRHPRRRAESRL